MTTKNLITEGWLDEQIGHAASIESAKGFYRETPAEEVAKRTKEALRAIQDATYRKKGEKIIAIHVGRSIVEGTLTGKGIKSVMGIEGVDPDLIPMGQNRATLASPRIVARVATNPELTAYRRSERSVESVTTLKQPFDIHLYTLFGKAPIVDADPAQLSALMPEKRQSAIIVGTEAVDAYFALLNQYEQANQFVHAMSLVVPK
jgi:hypothetical protein